MNAVILKLAKVPKLSSFHAIYCNKMYAELYTHLFKDFSHTLFLLLYFKELQWMIVNLLLLKAYGFLDYRPHKVLW